jgi:hypothetical protein
MGTEDNGWTQLLAALHSAGKDVDLDLSASTRSSNGHFQTGIGLVYPLSVDGMHNIVSIVLPNTTVTTIPSRAFNSLTNLTSIIIPDSISLIGGRAFSGCTGLTSIVIPDMVTRIGNYAFLDCTSLTSVTFEAATLYTIEAFIFINTHAALRIFVPVDSAEAYRAVASLNEWRNRIHRVGCEEDNPATGVCSCQ